MNKLRVIDLLNKIANGEEVPKKIKTTYSDYTYTIWEYNGIDYKNKDNDYLFEIHTRINKNDLNEEIEIIEEEKKIPEKIEYIVTDENGGFSINGFTFDYEQKMQIIDTLNQVIDYLKSKGE